MNQETRISNLAPGAPRVTEGGSVAIYSQDSVSHHRWLELDGLRGLAILLVIAWHYFACHAHGLEQRTLLAYLKAASGLAWCGVDLFFVLSGFLVGGILLDHREAPGIVSHFIARRMGRILPAYGLLLVMWLGTRALGLAQAPSASWLYAKDLPFVWYFTLLQNWAMAAAGNMGNPFMGVTWSLCIEEQFYLLLPAVVVFLPRAALPWVLGSLIAIAVGWKFAAPGTRSFLMTHSRMDTPLAGVWLAGLVRSSWWPRLKQRRSLLVGVTLLLGASWLALRGGNVTLGGPDHVALAALWSLVVLSALAWEGASWTAPLRWRWLRYVAAISYGLYLFHEPVHGLITAWLAGGDISVTHALWTPLTILAFALSVFVAHLSFRLVESPVLRHTRERFPYTPRRSVKTSPTLLS